MRDKTISVQWANGCQAGIVAMVIMLCFGASAAKCAVNIRVCSPLGRCPLVRWVRGSAGSTGSAGPLGSLTGSAKSAG
eukprot:1154636-Amphidinium_carterae.1